MDVPCPQMPATELVALYAARRVSPVEATKAARAEIERHNPALNAYCLVDDRRALEAARL